jgi:hypothetical protein
MRSRPHRNEAAYPALWRAICGAVRDAAACHSDIQIPDKRRSSIVKRAVGNVLALNGVRAAKAADRPGLAIVPLPGDGADCEGVGGLADPPGQPQRARRKPGRGMFPWPPSGLDTKGRAALRAFLRMTRGRFDSFHRGPDGLVFVKIRGMR